jgi:hypothetical protein
MAVSAGDLSGPVWLSPLASLTSHKTRTSIVQLESERPTKASVARVLSNRLTRRESGLWLRRQAVCGYVGYQFPAGPIPAVESRAAGRFIRRVCLTNHLGI